MSKGKVQYRPLYLQVKDLIMESIAEGEYKSGELIPPEPQLARQFGASITTIRQALSILVSEGFLERKQGKGTFVADQKVTLRFCFT